MTMSSRFAPRGSPTPRSTTSVGARVGLAPRLDTRLREGYRGEWEGRLFVDIEREDPDGYAAWRRAGADFRFPGGESLLEQQQRVTEALTEIHGTGQLPPPGAGRRGRHPGEVAPRGP